MYSILTVRSSDIKRIRGRPDSTRKVSQEQGRFYTISDGPCRSDSYINTISYFHSITTDTELTADDFPRDALPKCRNWIFREKAISPKNIFLWYTKPKMYAVKVKNKQKMREVFSLRFPI